jgi:hypothetical protein
MSIGQRKRKIIRVSFEAGSPVRAVAEWQLQIEDSVGVDHTDGAGQVEADLGPWNTAKNLTLNDVRATLLALVAAIPGHDVAS